MIALAIVNCSKKDDEGGSSGGGSKLSPPSWIQGTWEDEGGLKIKFTKDDIVINDIASFKVIYNITVSKDCKTSTKEKTKNNSLYEVTVTATCQGEGESGTFKFKKVDDSHIEFSTDHADYETDDAVILEKQ